MGGRKIKYKFDLSAAIKRVVEWELRNYRDNRHQLDRYIADRIPSAGEVISMADLSDECPDYIGKESLRAEMEM